MTISLSQLLAARTSDQLLAQLIQALKGVGFVRQTGSGTGSVQASGVAQGNFAVVVEITTTGEIGSAKYHYSLNGGAIWSAISAVPSTPVGLPGTGVTIAFAAGPADAGDSFVALDQFTFYVATPTFGQTAWQQFSWQRRILEGTCDRLRDHRDASERRERVVEVGKARHVSPVVRLLQHSRTPPLLPAS